MLLLAAMRRLLIIEARLLSTTGQLHLQTTVEVLTQHHQEVLSLPLVRPAEVQGAVEER